MNERIDIDAWLRAARPGDAVRTCFDSPRHWLPHEAHLPRAVHALLWCDADGRHALLGEATPGDGEPAALAARGTHARIALDAALPLRPVRVPKPWGEELWFTGIEARGVSQVGGGRTAGADAPGAPLPDVLALAPQWFRRGDMRAPLLLKVLAPHAEPALGELYFELHERKRELYVVTGIDARAWPGGEGGIRLGFAPALRARLGDDGLRAAYLDAARAYERVRRTIDAQLDDARAAAGLALDAPLPPARMAALLQRVPEALRAEEARLRAALNDFTQVRRLRVGDVVHVPTHVPHGLLHGVRVAEFQSPDYERRILAFGQKVLTQPHWDTAEAVHLMRLDVPAPPPPQVVDADGCRCERIGAFEDFTVWRVRLAARGTQGAPTRWQPPVSAYAVCMGLGGRVHVAGTALGAEEACLVPHAALGDSVLNDADTPATLLWATPA